MTQNAVLDVLTSGISQAILGLVGVGLGVLPFAVRNRRLSYRELYNSRIGIGADDSTNIVSAGDGLSAADEVAARTIGLLDRMSIVVIRIQNTGKRALGPSSFEEPLSFTFGRRVVWNARISETPSDQVKDLVGKNMVFFDPDPSGATPDGGEQVTIQQNAGLYQARLFERITRFVRPPITAELSTAPPPTAVEARYHGVRLTKVDLQPKQMFKLVVVLYEPFDGQQGGHVAIDKTVQVDGRLSDGDIEDERSRPWLTLPKVAGGLAGLVFIVLLVSSLVAILTPAPSEPAALPAGITCAPGDLEVVGSSVFMPVIKPMTDRYSVACGGQGITTSPVGSKNGLRRLKEPPGATNELVLLHDGLADNPPQGERHPVAVTIYSVVVNSKLHTAGVTDLTTDQLGAIWSGEAKTWNQVVPTAPPIPIRIVSRGGESGTRAIFQNKVLKNTEGALTSDDCENKATNVNPEAPIRCERPENQDVINMISAVEGTIGYVDAPPTKPERRDRKIVPLTLNGVTPDIGSIRTGAEPQGEIKNYEFWTVEYLYTRGEPATDSRLRRFLEYVESPAGSELLRSEGYTACRDADGVLHPLCR